MPGGQAHTGQIGVSQGVNPNEIVEQSLAGKPLGVGGIAQIPSENEIWETPGESAAAPSLDEIWEARGAAEDIVDQVLPNSQKPGALGEFSREKPVSLFEQRRVKQDFAPSMEQNVSPGHQLQSKDEGLAAPQPVDNSEEAEDRSFNLPDLFDDGAVPKSKNAALRTPRQISMRETGEMVSAMTSETRPIEGEDEWADIRASRSNGEVSTTKDNADNVVEPYQPVKQEPVYTADLPNSKFYQAQRATKAATTSAVASKDFTGNGFSEKAIASRAVDPGGVSIGTRVVSELVREPGNNLIQIVNEATGKSYTAEQLIDENALLEFCDDINANDIYVVAGKSPVPNPSSSQSRKLYVHLGRGVLIHPTQTKIYNLDFDGDPVFIQFQNGGGLFRGAMDYLINEMDESVIDMKFFPLPELNGSKDEFIEKFRELFLKRLDPSIDVDSLASRLYDVIHPELASTNNVPTAIAEDPEAFRDFLMKRVIREMDSVASFYSNKKAVLSYMLKDIFDTLKAIENYEIEYKSITEPDLMSDMVELEDADQYVTMVINDVAKGHLPPNFQDFLIGLGRYIGEIPGKNVMFRLGADVAKRIKFSGDKLVKGEDGARELYQLTLEAGMAMFMNSRASIGEKISGIKSMVKQAVIKEVGFPENYANLNEWANALVSSYNHYIGIANMASVEFGCDFDPVYSTKENGQVENGTKRDNGMVDYPLVSQEKGQKKGKDLSDAILFVYGDYTVSRLFRNISFKESLTIKRKSGGSKFVHWKNSLLLERYKTYTLSKLSRDNRLSGLDLAGITSENMSEMQIIFSIADKRSRKASKFNRDLEELLGNFAKALVGDKGKPGFEYHYAHRAENQADFLAYTNDLMSCFHLSGPDMFAYFGMEDPSSFLNSYYGKLLMKAAGKSGSRKKSDYIGGVRMAMVIQYRLRVVQNINAEIDRLITEEPDNMLYTIPRINELQNRLLDELAVLGSSSDLWSILVKEIEGDTSAFDALVESKGAVLEQFSDANDRAKGNKYWKRSTRRHHSLLELLSDPEIPKSDKEQIAVDVIRYATGFNDLKAYEVNYQLEIGPHSSYTTLSTMAYRDQPNILSDIETANNRFQRFFENDWNAITSDVKKAREMSSPGDLDAYIKNMYENPQEYIEVNDDMIVDAIDAQMDKTSRASEKAHQEIPVTVLYQALMQQKGGFTNAMYRTESRTFGFISESSVNAYDILYVLSHPDESLTVYNGSTRFELSRASLCGDNSEEALWNMLESNPRIASILRPGMASVSKTEVYRNASSSLQLAMARPSDRSRVLKGKVKAELTDHPMFLAMVAMFRPQSGRTSESLRGETKAVLNELQLYIIGLAASGESVSAKAVLENMGVTPESLQKIGGMDETAAEEWYNDMAECLNRYISDVRKIIKDGRFEEEAKDVYRSRANIDLLFDASSVALAIDVRQTMTGAKTEKSTDIEGGMTQENLGLGLWCMSAKDKYTVIDGNMSDEELLKYIGCMTNAGPFVIEDIGSLGIPDEGRLGKSSSTYAQAARNSSDLRAMRRKIRELESKLGEGVPLVVEMPEWMVRQDSTLDGSESFQITSVARFAITKRTKAAEDYNLKAKKAGDDGLDSITKSSRYSSSAKDNIGIIRNIYENEGRFAAVVKMAEMLQSADREEGYGGMDLADYMNIADLMLIEISDGTGLSDISIRMMGEISLAIRSNMPSDIVQNGTPYEKIEAASEIASRVGSEEFVNDDFFLTPEYYSNASLVVASRIASNTGVEPQFRPAKSAKMSSPERSFDLLSQIVSKAKPDGTRASIKPKSELLAQSRKIMDRLPDTFVPPIGYDIIGIVGKDKDGNDVSSKMISPGQTSVWVITEGASEERIKKALQEAYWYGMTVMFEDPLYLGSYADVFASDILDGPNGLFMLPFFSMRLNGAASVSPPMAPASFQFDPSWVWYSVEDSRNMYGLADGESIVSGEVAERTKCTAGGVESISLDDLFFNTRETYPDKTDKVEFCTNFEIQNEIVNWRDGGPTIDIGIAPENSNYERRMEKLKLQIEEYRRSFETADEYGFLPSGSPDRIIGWVKCYVRGEGYVYAPIIPWQTGSNLKAPTRFDLGNNKKVSTDTDTFDFEWRISEDIDGQYCKVHDGMGAAGKSMVMFIRGLNLGKLRNGRSIDMVTAAESFASRRLAWGKRMCTLKTLALTMALPPYGYNYAEHDASFPDIDPKKKKDIASRRLTIEEWRQLYPTIGRISKDPEVDALLKKMIELALETGTTNPSDILSTRFGDSYTFMYVDYDFFFETSMGFQNALMKWYNSMQPDVCPPDIHSFYNRTDGKGYLFKPLLGGSEYETGCLQMAVPHQGVHGEFWRYENVYASFSFYNDDYSGMHKVGLDGASRTMEQLNAMALSGKPLDGREMQLYTENTAALTSRPSRPYDRELDPGRFITRKR